MTTVHVGEGGVGVRGMESNADKTQSSPFWPEKNLIIFREQLSPRSGQSLQLRGIYDVQWSEINNESIYIFGILRGGGSCGNFSKCKCTSNQCDRANFRSPRRGRSPRASDGGKARCAPLHRPSANRVEPSRV